MTQSKQRRSRGCECCKVEALLSVDDRGQMVLPKEIRDKANIRGGDKLALTTIEKEGVVCCLLLTKADTLVAAVRMTLGQAAEGLLGDAAA